jgi:Transglycosylase-like domain
MSTACLGAVLLAPLSAGADQVSDLRTQATAVAQKLLQERLEADALNQQYSVATQLADADASALAQLQQRIDQDTRQISGDMTTVRAQAIQSYMSASTDLSGTAAVLFKGDPERTQIADEYTTLAAGTIETSVDRLRVAQGKQQADVSALLRQQGRDRAMQARQAAALAHATAVEGQLTALQSQVKGQLATAIDEEAAAQGAKAATAVAAAQGAAANTAASPAPAGSTGSSSPPIVDPALNPFLQCVVRVESGGNYQAVSPNGLYMGAFQFSQGTWNLAAQAAGLSYLVGVPPNRATKAEQDSVAVALYALDGQQPWLSDGCA